MTQPHTRRPYRELARTNEAVYRSLVTGSLAVRDRTVAKLGNASFWLIFRPYLESGEYYANGWSYYDDSRFAPAPEWALWYGRQGGTHVAIILPADHPGPRQEWLTWEPEGWSTAEQYPLPGDIPVDRRVIAVSRAELVR